MVGKGGGGCPVQPIVLQCQNPLWPLTVEGILIDRRSDRPIIEKDPIDRGSDRPIIENGPIDPGSYRPNVR